RAPHLVLVGDDGARGADDAAEHGLLEEVEPSLGAKDLLFQLVDVFLQGAEAHGVGPLVGAAAGRRSGRRRVSRSGRRARRNRGACCAGRWRRRGRLRMRRRAHHQRKHYTPQGAVRPTRKNGPQRCHVVTPSGVERGVLGRPEERSSFEAAFLYQDPQVRSIFGFSAISTTSVLSSFLLAFWTPVP